MTKYQWFLLFSFAVAWVWAAINPLHPSDWLLENYLVFVFVPIIFALGRYFKLSNISYTLITIFMILHVIGAHYTYADVPFGVTLGDWMGTDRNMYDRLVHFSFGLLLAYPLREMFYRVAKTRGTWGFYLPIDVTMAFSALYEIIEWAAAANVSPELGMDFLGSQGDVWDAQKDMMLATLGAVFAMAITALINWRYNPNFWQEIKDGFKLEKGDMPLGEVKLHEFMENGKKGE